LEDSTPESKSSSISPLIEARLRKIRDMEAQGLRPFHSGFVPDTDSTAFHEMFSGIAGDEVSERRVRMAGRVMAIRVLGKATFASIRDGSGDFQAYFGRDTVGLEPYKLVKKLDVGDIIGVEGAAFRTKTAQLSVLVHGFTILTKSMRPLPEKWHGLTDVETRYRQRYVDLIVNPSVREMVRTRSRIISYLRAFLTEKRFLEVETPMMQTIPGGATAKPFITYHHALARNLYLRIAPELYLKRLLVGGFERVFEINRNFRNEGVSTQHNPEFTMLEMYQAYGTYLDLMDLTEEMLSGVASHVLGSPKTTYQGRELDLTPPWRRLTVRDALLAHGILSEDQIDQRNTVFITAVERGLEVNKEDSLGKLWIALFEQFVEPLLWGPVFVTHYPVEVSPLARRNEENPLVTDRFELYMCGREMANAFTELTDPFDQRRRFEEQVKAREAGDEEAHFLDEDFLNALEYGMPPAAGEGIGIDRLVMILTDSASIRDVILFPHMRSKKEPG
jgi:lysyl-tRNA synthetase class 2